VTVVIHVLGLGLLDVKAIQIFAGPKAHHHTFSVFVLVMGTMTLLATAIRSGLADAKAAKTPYFWCLLSNPAQRADMISDAWKSVGRVFIQPRKRPQFNRQTPPNNQQTLLSEESQMSLVETQRPEEIPPKDRGRVLAEERTNLALQRTIIASERTLMAWIRTAISMIGFGFTIYKFFQYQAEEIAAGNIRRPQAPRNLGMSLIALGTLGLTAAAWQHRRFLNEIGAS
jgi:uncharacterized membrane protein YidH (DUF202 family)